MRRRTARRARRCCRRCASCPTPCATRARRRGRASPRRRGGSLRRRRYWAIVGNGPNQIAAEEMRIKLSRALLQVDRLRRHRGQEAHRPVVRAADPRVRRRPVGSTADDVAKEVAIYRAHKAAPDRHRHRGRGALPRRARTSSRCRPSHPALAFVLSAMVGHLFGYEAALPSTRRPARCARPASGIERAPSATASTGRRAARRRLARRARAARRSGSSTACAPAPTTATSRRRTAVRLVVAAALRHRRSRRSTPTRSSSGKVGTPAWWSTTSPRRSPRHRGAHPPGRRHQAPGQDRHRRHLPLRRGAARRAAGAGRARRRRAPRPAQLPHAAHARRPRSRRGRGRRLHPLPHRGRRRPATATHRRSSTAAASRRRHRRRAPSATRAAGHQAPGRRRARGAGGPGPQRRPHGAHRARGQGRRRRTGITLLHVRFADRLPAAVCAGVLQGYRGRYARCATR